MRGGRRLVRILAAMLLAYLVGALVLGLCVNSIAYFASKEPTSAVGNGLFTFLGTMLISSIMIFGIMIYAVFWQSLLAIFIAETTNLRTWVYFVLVGLFIGHTTAISRGLRPFGADVLDFVPAKGEANYLYFSVLAAAVTGSLTYWWWAHRKSESTDVRTPQ